MNKLKLIDSMRQSIEGMVNKLIEEYGDNSGLFDVIIRRQHVKGCKDVEEGIDVFVSVEVGREFVELVDDSWAVEEEWYNQIPYKHKSAYNLWRKLLW